MRTAEVRVEDFVAVQEVGKVINPVLAAGQIEGGIAQGIGMALYENVVWQEGRMVNGQMTNYIMPTSMDVPRDSRFFRRGSLRARARGREGNRRVAARRHGAGDRECDFACDRRKRDARSGDSRNSQRNLGERRCLTPQERPACSLLSTGGRRRSKPIRWSGC